MAKSRQRQFIPGQDGRRSMMDWGKQRDGDVTPPTDPDAVAATHESPDTPKAVPRSKSHMSIFGPDLVYQRDAARRVELDRIEAEEREAEEKREAAVWEKERLKSERKKLKKNKNSERLAAEQKLEGRSPSRIGGDAPAPSERRAWCAYPSPDANLRCLIQIHRLPLDVRTHLRSHHPASAVRQSRRLSRSRRRSRRLTATPGSPRRRPARHRPRRPRSATTHRCRNDPAARTHRRWTARRSSLRTRRSGPTRSAPPS